MKMTSFLTLCLALCIAFVLRYLVEMGEFTHIFLKNIIVYTNNTIWDNLDSPVRKVGELP